jgi:hypothetical protein
VSSLFWSKCQWIFDTYMSLLSSNFFAAFRVVIFSITFDNRNIIHCWLWNFLWHCTGVQLYIFLHLLLSIFPSPNYYFNHIVMLATVFVFIVHYIRYKILRAVKIIFWVCNLVGIMESVYSPEHWCPLTRLQLQIVHVFQWKETVVFNSQRKSDYRLCLAEIFLSILIVKAAAHINSLL